MTLIMLPVCAHIHIYMQKTAAAVPALYKIDYKVWQEHKTVGTMETCIKSVKQMRE